MVAGVSLGIKFPTLLLALVQCNLSLTAMQSPVMLGGVRGLSGRRARWPEILALVIKYEKSRKGRISSWQD